MAAKKFIFVYDAAAGRYVAIGDETATIPDDLEVAIAERLYSFV